MKKERQTEGGRKRGREGGKVCSPCIPLLPPPPPPPESVEWQQREKVGGSEELEEKKTTGATLAGCSAFMTVSQNQTGFFIAAS